MKKISKAAILAAVLITASLVTLYVTLGRKAKETISPISPAKDTERYVRLQQPGMLTYDELVALERVTRLTADSGTNSIPLQQRLS